VSDRAGQKTGQAPPVGYSWADYLGALVEAHGTLTQVAWKVLEHGGDTEDVASVERALRRLRSRGQRDGGAWGQRLLRVFGVPAAIENRLRWMGLYQSPFNDLPLSLCLDQLRLWDRPPLSASRARLWLHLGYASCALRQRAFDDARAHLRHATAAAAGLTAEYDAARIEIALMSAYLASREQGDVRAGLDDAARLLENATLSAADSACFAARLADQRAFQLNRAGDHAGALALYQSLPAADAHPFASYRRDAGLAYGYLRTGRREQAIACATRAVEHAGDGGYVRLRVMGLLLQHKIDGDAAHLARARAIAERLEDGELLARVARVT
jgi:tetratricopeptide (TPR) repeat protein